MNSTSTFQPNWVSAPGATILDILHERDIPLSKFSEAMGLSYEYVSRLVHGDVEITFDIANKLQHNLGGSVNFWQQRETQYRIDIQRTSVLKEEIDPKTWLKGLPIKDMVKFGWIQEGADILTSCLNFFQVQDITSWQIQYENLLLKTSFRKSDTFVSTLGATAAWLRQGEILGNMINCKDWDEELFEERLEEIRTLTRKKNPQEFLPILTKLCAECGVAVSIARTPTGCRASGATKFITPTKALLLLSFRYLSDDQFWFTFFHEAGHLMLHGKNSFFLESISDQKTEIQEEEANLFAAEMLIPDTLQVKLSKIRSNKRDIINFAMEAGVSPGIVVGQMQYRGYIDYKYLNSYKRRYNWEDILDHQPTK